VVGPVRSTVLGAQLEAYLEKAGDLRERLLGVAEVEHGMELFARLHFERWQRPFNEHWRRFYGAIAVSQAARGVPVISVLEFNGEPISVLVNFRADRREYSIGAAFTPVAVKRVSPGWLHLGMAIERACADGMEVFDFLGGEGKNEQYKAAFGGRSERLLCLQLLRAPRLKWLYRAWDRVRRIGARRTGGSS
jgi:CelD/BcsL family acetyltransferase involved in cellulose biosynthesis